MPSPSDPGRRTGLFTTTGLILLPIFCCALPLLIAAGALGAVGSVLGNPWVIAAAVAAGAGFIAVRVRGHHRG